MAGNAHCAEDCPEEEVAITTRPATGSHICMTLLLAALACDGCVSAQPMPLLAQQAQPPSRQPPAPAQAQPAGASGVAARGQGDYATYCAPCHGARGGGDGPLAAMLDPRPARHSDAVIMSTLSDEYLFRLLKEGGPALGKSPLMGVWGRLLSEQRIHDLVAYLRSLAAPGERKVTPREKDRTAGAVKVAAVRHHQPAQW